MARRILSIANYKFAMNTIMKRRLQHLLTWNSANSKRIETINIIREGHVRWIAKDDITGAAMFNPDILGLPIR